MFLGVLSWFRVYSACRPPKSAAPAGLGRWVGRPTSPPEPRAAQSRRETVPLPSSGLWKWTVVLGPFPEDFFLVPLLLLGSRRAGFELLGWRPCCRLSGETRFGGEPGPGPGIQAAGGVPSPPCDPDPSRWRSRRLSGATWRPLSYSFQLQRNLYGSGGGALGEGLWGWRP